MWRAGLRVPQGSGRFSTHPIVRGSALGRRAGAEDGGILAAVGCVLIAVLLYVIAVQVLGIDEDVIEGSLGAALRNAAVGI